MAVCVTPKFQNIVQYWMFAEMRMCIYADRVKRDGFEMLVDNKLHGDSQ